MTTIAEIDRLVRDNDEIVARLLPRLGPRVRNAYTANRNAWIALRRGADAGKSIPPATLAAQKQTFSGWARAFRAASGRPAKAVSRATPAAPPRSVATSTAEVETALAPRPPSHKRTGYALAAGVALVGLAAFATRRKRK